MCYKRLWASLQGSLDGVKKSQDSHNHVSKSPPFVHVLHEKKRWNGMDCGCHLDFLSPLPYRHLCIICCTTIKYCVTEVPQYAISHKLIVWFLDWFCKCTLKYINGCKNVPKLWKWCFRSTSEALLAPLQPTHLIVLSQNRCGEKDWAGIFWQILCRCTGDQVKGWKHCWYQASCTS